MMLWATPAAYEGTDSVGLTASGGFIDRILRAGNPP
jgi:hypothetical protein